MRSILHSVLLVCTLAMVPVAAQARDVVVFAAASLKNALDDAVSRYEDRSGVSVVVSYAGSSALARQIQQGAPADIFISANVLWMDVLSDQALIAPETRFVLAGNALVLVGVEPRDMEWSISTFQNALGPDGRLAMALVDAVPAGIYGKAAFEALGVWPDLAPYVAQTDNVRSALRLVSLGEAQLGVVYLTDALLEDNVEVLARFPDGTHPPIRYPIAQVSDSTHPMAGDLLAFLQSEAAQAVFDQHGFPMGSTP